MIRYGRTAAVLAILLTAGAGGWLLAGPDEGSRRHVVVDGVPLDEVHPPTSGERHPGVVVAHGFAGSARLMAQFGDTLAARGFVVVLLDFSGHGASTRRLPDDTAALQRDLDVAAAHLRSLPDVDPSRIALAGHSMGAAAVTRYAVTHPEITATVAMSLPDSSMVPPDRPARLLLLVGALEFPGFHAEAERAAERSGGSMVVVPFVEHISILYAPRTHHEVAKWLGSDGDLPFPMRRVGGAAILLVALAAGMYPLARLLFGAAKAEDGWPRLSGRDLGRTVVVAVPATAIAAVVAVLLPADYLPLDLGSYVVGFIATAGLAILIYARRRGRATGPSRLRLVIATPVLLGYAAAAIAVPMHLGLTHAVPGGIRWWLLVVVWAGFALLAYGAERLTGGNSLGVLAVSAVAVIGLTGAAAVGFTSGFVILVVPLLAILLLWQAAWSAVLHRFAAPSWLIASAGSVIVAWPLATALPVIG